MIENNLIYETEYWKILLNPDQQNLAKSTFVLKSGTARLSDLNAEEWCDFEILVRQFENTIESLFTPSHFNWVCLMNNSYKIGGDKLPHIHWHVAPRYPELKNVFGHVFTDENYPSTNKVAKIIDEKLMFDLTENIKRAWKF